MKRLLHNCIIVDGTGQPPFRGDVEICGNRIGRVGTFAYQMAEYDEVLDGDGAFLTPGFIDLHSHADLSNLLPDGMRPKIMQGVTTEVTGQCGLGVAPLPARRQPGWRQNLVIGNPPLTWEWESTAQYLQCLEKHGLESNLLPFVGHGTLRYAVKGDDPAPMTPEELAELRELTRGAFEEGVRGLSMGLIYFPAIFSNHEELRTVVEVASAYRAPVAVHMRSEGDELVEALQELIDLTCDLDCHLHISHLKALGPSNAPKVQQALELIHAHGLTFDHYPYLAGSTTLLVILPPALLQGGIEKTLHRLQSPTIRAQVKRIFAGREAVERGIPWDNLVQLVGFANIRIADVGSAKNQNLLGLSLTEIAELWNTDPADAALDLLIEERGNVRMLDVYMEEATLEQILRAPEGRIGSDGLFGGRPHPRLYGTYPRILNRYVFQRKLLTLEAAVAKMTSQVADLLGLIDRGRIAPGMAADLALFAGEFRDLATYEEPCRCAEGLRYLFINGEVKVRDGEYLAVQPGKVIRSAVNG